MQTSRPLSGAPTVVRTAPATATGADTGPVRDAIADGKVARSERTLFEGGANATVVDSEQDRLRSAIRERERQLPEEAPPVTRTEHRELEAQIADETALVGALDAERVSIESGVPDGLDDFQQLREEAQPWIDQFNANGGQYYEGNDMFGDDWDTSEVDFERLADRFAGRPELLEDFARVQGSNDDSIGDDPEGHFSDVAGDDPELAEQLRLRYEASLNLQGIFERYLVANAGMEAAQPRLDAIDEEQGDLETAIDEDEQQLAQSTVDMRPQHATSIEEALPLSERRQLEQAQQQDTPDDGVTEAASDVPEAPEEIDPEAEEPATPEEPVEVVTPSATPPNVPEEAVPEPPVAAAAPMSQDVADQSPVQVPVEAAAPVEATATATAPAAIPTDAELIDLAVASGIIEAAACDAFSFNEAGELQYAARQGDGYWHAAEHVKPADGQDFGSHWQAVWSENSMRNHGVADEQLVLVGQQVVFPGYTRDSLVDLLAPETAAT